MNEKETTKHERRITFITSLDLRRKAHMKALKEDTKLSYVLIDFLKKWTKGE